LIPEFLAKAQENLHDAERAFEEGRYNASGNRAYYSAFQAAIAALASESITNDKNPHSWVQAQFSELLVKRRKRYPAKMASMLLPMQEIRDKADYKSLFVSKNAASQQLRDAKEFLSHILERISL
jgi:uncharacterized protein (UPF0332 family)